jgi:hypothetical protein
MLYLLQRPKISLLGKKENAVALPKPKKLLLFSKNFDTLVQNVMFILISIVRRINKKKFVTQSRTGLQIYEGHGDQLNRPGPMA